MYENIGKAVFGLMALTATLAAIGFTVATPFLWWLAIQLWRTK